MAVTRHRGPRGAAGAGGGVRGRVAAGRGPAGVDRDWLPRWDFGRRAARQFGLGFGDRAQELGDDFLALWGWLLDAVGAGDDGDFSKAWELFGGGVVTLLEIAGKLVVVTHPLLRWVPARERYERELIEMGLAITEEFARGYREAYDRGGVARCAGRLAADVLAVALEVAVTKGAGGALRAAKLSRVLPPKVRGAVAARKKAGGAPARGRAASGVRGPGNPLGLVTARSHYMRALGWADKPDGVLRKLDRAVDYLAANADRLAVYKGGLTQADLDTYVKAIDFSRDVTRVRVSRASTRGVVPGLNRPELKLTLIQYSEQYRSNFFTLSGTPGRRLGIPDVDARKFWEYEIAADVEALVARAAAGPRSIGRDLTGGGVQFIIPDADTAVKLLRQTRE